jgi:hypothetical protein
MKNKIMFLTAMVLLLAIPTVKAQKKPESPVDYTLKKEKDYEKYEKNVKEDVNWFIKSSVDKDTNLRNEIAGFLLKWVSGSPNVSVTLNSVAVALIADTLFKYDADLLVAYMGGVAVYELNHPKEKDEWRIEMAGVEAVLDMVKHSGDLFAKCDAVKDYQDMKDKGTLEKYIKDIIEKDKKKKEGN